MITMTNLGENGRLGNQMFQYAALKGISKKNGLDFSIPLNNSSNEYFYNALLENFELVKTVKIQLSGQYKQINEKYFHFDEDLFNNCPDNVSLNGHFQSEKYFNHIENEIKKDFKFINANLYSIPNYDYVSIHVRRGDYTHQFHNYYQCEETYYVKAMSYFPKNTNFLIVSDDIDWCKQQEYFKNCNFFTGKNNIQDLYVLTKSKSNIIANSTFSWWGAWLNDNPNKTVISPKNWFGINFIDKDTKDLIPEKWIKI